MFNDAVFTSWAVEQRRIDYKPSLMLLDLANFLIVSVALLSLNPSATNAFAISFEQFSESLNERGFWFVLALYWSVGILWSKHSGIYSAARFPRRLANFAWLLSAAFFAQAAVGRFGSAEVANFTRVTVATIAFGYIAWHYLHILSLPAPMRHPQ
jgi:hypothetical protein